MRLDRPVEEGIRDPLPHPTSRTDTRWSTVKRIPEETRIQQINARPNIEFVRWADVYQGKDSKAVCRCALDGFEWATSVHSLINNGTGCPKCAGSIPPTAGDRIDSINRRRDISFCRWSDGYRNHKSKAIVKCCIDGFEWAATVNSLLGAKSHGCPQCANNRRWTAEERIAQINSLPNISFVRWDRKYRNCYSKAVCRCGIDGTEWAARVDNLLNIGQGCPRCAEYGFNPSKPGTLYILRSECGTMVKIGISNNHEQRHAQLRRRTPFNWSCIELLHSDDGSLIAELEKELHSFTEPATFREPFDGYTEWRKWDDRLPKWIKRYRARLDRYNKAP